MTRTKIISAIALVSFLSIFLFLVSNNQINSTQKNNELLENVSLIKSTYINEFTLDADSGPNAILADSKGFVWTVGSNSRLYKFDPSTNKLDSVYIIGGEEKTDSKNLMMGWTIIEDNDGFLWLSQVGGSLWRFDPDIEKFDFYNVSATPFQMKVDKETGDIWFTTMGDTVGVIHKLGDDQSNDYRIKEFDVGENTFPSGLFPQNGHVWVAQVTGNKLTKFKINQEDDTISSIEKVFEIPSDNKTRIHSPTDVFVDNSAIWFTEHGTSTISQYLLTENQVKRFPTSRSMLNATTLPFWLKEPQKGDGMWINEHTGNKIAFFNTKDMTLTEYEIPSRPADGSVVYPLGLAVTPHYIWFSEWNANKIAVIDAEKPIPFEIRVEEDSITIPPSGASKIINLEVTRNDNTETRPISLTVSSSMEPSLELVNMTATFSEEKISLGETNSKRIQLIIDSLAAPSGEYTLAISATNGLVTKSAFVSMVIE